MTKTVTDLFNDVFDKAYRDNVDEPCQDMRNACKGLAEDVFIHQQKRINELENVLNECVGKLDLLHNEKWKDWKEKACMFSQGEASAYEHSMNIINVLRGDTNE